MFEPVGVPVWSSGINFSEFSCHQVSGCQLSLSDAASVCLPGDLLPPGYLELETRQSCSLKLCLKYKQMDSKCEPQEHFHVHKVHELYFIIFALSGAPFLSLFFFLFSLLFACLLSVCHSPFLPFFLLLSLSLSLRKVRLLHY